MNTYVQKLLSVRESKVTWDNHEKKSKIIKKFKKVSEQNIPTTLFMQKVKVFFSYLKWFAWTAAFPLLFIYAKTLEPHIFTYQKTHCIPKQNPIVVYLLILQITLSRLPNFLNGNNSF